MGSIYIIDVNTPPLLNAVSEKGERVFKVRENSELESIVVEEDGNITSVYFPELSVERVSKVINFFENIHIDFVFSFSEKYRSFWFEFSKRKEVKTNLTEDYLKTGNKLQTRRKVNGISKNKVNVYTVDEFLELGGSYPVIIKPIVGRGSENVSLISNEDELQSLLLNLDKEQYFIEKYVDGIEVSIEAIHANGDHIIYGVTETLQYTNSFVETGHISNIRTLNDQERREMYNIYDSLNYYNTVSHTEVLLTSQGIVYIESHPRLAGGLIPTLTEANFTDDFYLTVLGVFMGELTNEKINIVKDDTTTYFSFFPEPSITPSYFHITEQTETDLKSRFGINLISTRVDNGSIVYSTPKHSLDIPLALSGNIVSSKNPHEHLEELAAFCKVNLFSEVTNE